MILGKSRAGYVLVFERTRTGYSAYIPTFRVVLPQAHAGKNTNARCYRRPWRADSVSPKIPGETR